MLAAVSLVVVSLSVELTSPQTRAGDVHGRHPLASAAVHVYKGGYYKGREGRGLKCSHFAHNKDTVST